MFAIADFAGHTGYTLNRLEPAGVADFVDLGLPTCAFMHGRPPDQPELIRRSFNSFVKEYAFARESEIFVVRDRDGVHCAQIWLHFTHNRFNGLPELWVWDLTVRAQDRGHGLGRALLNFAREKAQQRGVAELWLLVSSKNSTAISIYRSFGLQEAGYLMSAPISEFSLATPVNSSLLVAGLRPLRPADVPALYDLWSAAGLSFKIHGRDRQDRLSAHFARPETGGWAIERDHKIIACCLTSSDGRKGWIERLATAPEQRRSGLAAVLVAAAKQSLLDSGNLVIGALIENDNTASRLLFEAAGFVRDNDYSYFSFRQSPES